jgi:putative endopeptidase
MVEEAAKRTVDLIQDAAKAGGAGNGQKIGDYYGSYMDEAAIEAKGVTPLKADLARIAAIKDKRALAAVLGGNVRADVDALNATDFYTDNVLGLWVSPSFDDTSKYAPFLLQGGLGMPDRQYYVGDSAAMQDARAKYLGHIAKVLTLADVADADGKAARIMALETRIAQASGSRADSADVQKANNSWTQTDFATKAPGLDWKTFFAAAGLAGQPRFIVWHPSMVTGLGKVAADESLDTWKDYLTFHLLDHYSNLLPKAFVDERFAFYGNGPAGHAAVGGPLEARRQFDQRRAGRGRRPGLCRQVFPGPVQGRGLRHGRHHEGRLQRAYRRPGLDGPRDQGRGPSQGRGAEGWRRLSR